MDRKLVYVSVFALLLALALGLAACGPAPTEAPEPAAAVEEAAVEPEPTEAAEPAPEPTAVPAEAAEPEEEEPVVLRVGGLGDVDCWNSHSCSSIWFYGHLVMEGLADLGPASAGCEGVPRMAESWEVSEDGRTWTVKLHEGITFNDGTPVTAQTIVDFVDWWLTTDLIFHMAETLSMESIEALDELTFQYTTADPILNSPNYDFIWWYMGNPEEWSQFDNETLWGYESYPPVGTGAYEVTEHESGSHVIFDAREDYYRGKPPIDRVIYQIYSNNDALINAVQSGEIDLTLPYLPPESYDTLAGAEDITIEEKAPGAWHELIFNMHPEGSKHPAVDDPKVREAIDYAIDKEKIVELALLGHGITCPTNWGCGPNYESEMNPDLVVTPFDPDMANQILDEAGYEDTDGDGVRETPDGEPLEFRLDYQGELAPQLVMADLITTWLGEIGIGVEVSALEGTTWYDTILDERNFDMALDGDAHDIDPASMDFWYSCWAADAGSGALNYAGYCNEEMDGLVYEWWYATDPEARWEPMYQAQEMLNQDRPFIILAGQNSLQAYRSDRFEFPLDTCDVSLGMMSPQGLLNATVKDQ
ncbi:ABC transporter substrate-binding protein [Chloroflexota bacterium]